MQHRTTAPENDTATRAARHPMRTAALAILVDAGPPLAIFFALRALGTPDVLAYLAGSVVPIVRLVVDRIRHQPFNAISAMVAVLLVVSVVLALVTGDVRTVMARGGFIYLVIAIVVGATLPTRRPAMLVLSRYVAVRARPETATRFDEVFAGAAALRAMRTVTLVWTLGFLVSAVVCVICAYTLPITVAAIVTGLVEPLTALALAGGTTPYLRRVIASAH